MSDKAASETIDHGAAKIEERRKKVRDKVFNGIDFTAKQSLDDLGECRQRHLKHLYDKWKINSKVLLDKTKMFQTTSFRYMNGNTVYEYMSGMSHDVTL